MRKLITMILILALALPALTLAEEPDPIVGCWYTFIDNSRYPELMKNYGDYDYVLSAYLFAEDGKIYLLENDVKDGAATPVFYCCGAWDKAQDIRKYNYKIMGIGEGTIRLEEGGDMYLIMGDLSLHFRMMFPFSPYRDMSYAEVEK